MDDVLPPPYPCADFVGSNSSGCFVLIVENEKVAGRGLPFKLNEVSPVCVDGRCRIHGCQFGKGIADAHEREQDG